MLTCLHSMPPSCRRRCLYEQVIDHGKEVSLFDPRQTPEWDDKLGSRAQGQWNQMLLVSWAWTLSLGAAPFQCSTGGQGPLQTSESKVHPLYALVRCNGHGRQVWLHQQTSLWLDSTGQTGPDCDSSPRSPSNVPNWLVLSRWPPDCPRSSPDYSRPSLDCF